MKCYEMPGNAIFRTTITSPSAKSACHTTREALLTQGCHSLLECGTIGV